MAAGYEATAWGVRVQGTAANRETIYVAPRAAAPEPEASEEPAPAETEPEAAQEPVSAPEPTVVARPTPSAALATQMAGRVLRAPELTFDLPRLAGSRELVRVSDLVQIVPAQELTLHSHDGKVGSISEGDQPEQDREDPAAMTTTFFHQPETTESQAQLVRPTYGSGVIRALENAWHFLMSLHGELPDVIMVTGVGMEGFGGKWGHFRANGWNVKTADKKVKIGEIFMAGETLAKGGRKVMNTLTHEATHVLAAVRGVKDTSRQHRYHNGEFRKLAGELGMEYRPASPDKTIGFSAVTLTEVTVKAYEAIIEELDRAIQAEVSLPFWLGGGSEGGQDGDDNGDDEGGENVHGKRKPKDPNAPKTGNRKCVCNCDEPNIVYMSKKMIDKRVVECDDCDSLFREA